jgi:hypothetical protein
MQPFFFKRVSVTKLLKLLYPTGHVTQTGMYPKCLKYVVSCWGVAGQTITNFCQEGAN